MPCYIHWRYFWSTASSYVLKMQLKQREWTERESGRESEEKHEKEMENREDWQEIKTK